jgi:hypothetical protein
MITVHQEGLGKLEELESPQTINPWPPHRALLRPLGSIQKVFFLS